VFDLRSLEPAPSRLPSDAVASADRHGGGSNAWAVAGRLTKHGGAILANDMHLPLHVPNVWYRASLVWSDGSRE
jgi:penicillin amidase